MVKSALGSGEGAYAREAIGCGRRQEARERQVEFVAHAIDRDGQHRTTRMALTRVITRAACNLRHTYVCMRLMEGADIPSREELPHEHRDDREVPRRHQDMLDAPAINVRKIRRKIKQVEVEETAEG